MCGLFGAIGNKINPGTIRALAIVNRERGTDSLGFFSSTGKMCKQAGDPLACLGQANFADYIDKSIKKAWFLAGHTRWATQGKVTNRNAHPFRFGRFIGSHNGCVSIPKGLNYRVDSEYLFDSLSKADGDYQAAFANIAGYWGLTWFDGAAFYLQAHKNTIAIGCDEKGTWYYSSEAVHLDACVRLTRQFVVLEKGDTVRFNAKTIKPEFLKRFESTLPVFTAPATVKRVKAKRDKSTDTAISYQYDPIRDKWDDPFHVEEKGAWSDDWDAYVREYE